MIKRYVLPISFRFTGSDYLSIWLYLIFITSFVISNSVKGTTPAFLFAYISIIIPIFVRGEKASTFVRRFLLLFSIYLLITILSQVSLIVTSHLPSSDNLILVGNTPDIIVRSSLITQTLYLIPSFLLFSFVWTYFSINHNLHIKISLFIFVLLGAYHWIFYLLFKQNGDFLSNRIFGENDLLNPGQFQTLTLLGYNISRFVSLTGEPSMYVFSILPYCIYFMYRQDYAFAFVLLISLVFTFSGTFVMGLFIWFISHLAFTRYRTKALVPIFTVIIFIVIFLPGEILSYFIKEALLDKLNQESSSGLERAENIYNHMSYFFESSPLIQLTGLGFGAIRSTEMFSTLLVNVGLIGFILFSVLFAYPVFKLPKSDFDIKIGLIVIYIILIVSVSEYSYPSLWLFLGIGYNRLYSYKLNRVPSSHTVQPVDAGIDPPFEI